MSLLVWLPLDGDTHNQGIAPWNFSVSNTSMITVDNNGKIGKCYNFNSSSNNNGIFSGDNGFMNQYINNKSWSISAWVCTSSSDTCVISLSYGLRMFVGNTTYVSLYNSTRTINCNSSVAANNGKWNHLCVTYDIKTNIIKFYVNGIQTGTANYTSGETYASSWDNGLFIGKDPNNNTVSDHYLFKGKMNDLRIYNHALSTAEVHELAQGLVVHYKLDDRYGTNLIHNGDGVLNTYNWSNNNNISSDVPPNTSIKKSYYNNRTTQLTPIDSSHIYSLVVWVKSTGTSGYTYPSLLPYDIDKKFIAHEHCRDGFNLNTMTTLAQPLKPGDTKIYATNLSNWNDSSGHHYNSVAIFNYRDSTGHLYPEGTYTQNVPRFDSGSGAKTNLDKANNVITLLNAYCYPFGAISKSSINNWTQKATTLNCKNINRLKYAHYVYYLADWVNDILHAGITLIDLNETVKTFKDSSGYNHHGIVNDPTLQIIYDSNRYSYALLNNQTNNSSVFPFKGECNIPESTELTFSWWMNPSAIGLQTSGLFSTSNNDRPNDYSTTAANMRDSHFDCCNTSGTCVRINVENYLTLNEWHHYALTYNGTQLIFYKDGEQKVTAAQTGALKAFKYIFPFYSYAGGVNRCTVGKLNDFRIYVTALSAIDIKQLYNVGISIDNKGKLHSYELIENRTNIISYIEYLRLKKTWGAGLGAYTQSNCQVTLTDNGYRIYRPPNLTVSNNGNTMWGGLKVVNQTSDTVATYNTARDNVWDLQKGHTYIFALHAHGQTSNGINIRLSNQMGWDGYGLQPNPTVLLNSGLPNDFNGDKECFYIFTINDDIVKKCSTAYSSYQANVDYLSYRHIVFGWEYTSTGALGTDIYLTNLRLYDITDYMGNFNKKGQANFHSFIEQLDSCEIKRNSEILSTEFIER